jgi:hypothetical protein
MDQDQPAVYRIWLKGQLTPEWTGWFEGLTVTPDANGNTQLTGLVVDQAALHGLLRKFRDLGLILLSIITVDPGKEAPGAW